jgi:hypothetical protein
LDFRTTISIHFHQPLGLSRCVCGHALQVTNSVKPLQPPGTWWKPLPDTIPVVILVTRRKRIWRKPVSTPAVSEVFVAILHRSCKNQVPRAQRTQRNGTLYISDHNTVYQVSGIYLARWNSFHGTFAEHTICQNLASMAIPNHDTNISHNRRIRIHNRTSYMYFYSFPLPLSKAASPLSW